MSNRGRLFPFGWSMHTLVSVALARVSRLGPMRLTDRPGTSPFTIPFEPDLPPGLSPEIQPDTSGSFEKKLPEGGEEGPTCSSPFVLRSSRHPAAMSVRAASKHACVASAKPRTRDTGKRSGKTRTGGSRLVAEAQRNDWDPRCAKPRSRRGSGIKSRGSENKPPPLRPCGRQRRLPGRRKKWPKTHDWANPDDATRSVALG